MDNFGDDAIECVLGSVMIERAQGRTTVPQIFIREHHVGGCDDLFDLHHSGKLDELFKP